MPNPIPVDITKFLSKQTCVNICCLDEENNPYCFTCFYHFDEGNNCLYFKSQMNTHHAKLLEKNGTIAGTILEDTLDKILLKGIQLTGKVKRNSMMDISASFKYHAKYPIATTVPGDIWTVQLEVIKFTDNGQGFGHKTHWELKR